MNTLFSRFPTWLTKDAAAIARDCALIDESFHRAVYTLKRGQLHPFFSNQQRMAMRWLDQGQENKVKGGLLAVWDDLYGQFGKYLDHRLALPQPVLERERERNAKLFASLEAQLVDFWATWSKPCIAELPHVKSIYGKYRVQGFEVVGICLDDESARERATDILGQHDADWPQRLKGVGLQNDAYRQLYDINALPTVWLLNKEGKIVDRHARGEKLDVLTKNHLGL